LSFNTVKGSIENEGFLDVSSLGHRFPNDYLSLRGAAGCICYNSDFISDELVTYLPLANVRFRPLARGIMPSPVVPE
jgi:hypothetical protein